MANAFKVARELERIQKSSIYFSLEQLSQINPQTDKQNELHGSLLHQAFIKAENERGEALIKRASKELESGEKAKILLDITQFEEEFAPAASLRRKLEVAKARLRRETKKESILSPTLYSGLEIKDRAEMAFYLYDMAGVLLVSGHKQQFFSLYHGLPQSTKEVFNLLIHEMGACLNEFTITLDLTRAYVLSRQLAEAAIRTGYFIANGDDLGASAKEEVARMERELPEYMEQTQATDVIQAKFA
ncbi:MAG: hypothetical protein SNF33_01920 [Candidatus Algichlamydia australiensis]|nr:hypothetical protein [Chlamydiales bacterium]